MTDAPCIRITHGDGSVSHVCLCDGCYNRAIGDPRWMAWTDPCEEHENGPCEHCE